MIGYQITQGRNVLDIGTLATVDDCLTYAVNFVRSVDFDARAIPSMQLDNGYNFRFDVYSSCVYVHDEFCGTFTKYVDGIGHLLSVENCFTN